MTDWLCYVFFRHVTTVIVHWDKNMINQSIFKTYIWSPVFSGHHLTLIARKLSKKHLSPCDEEKTATHKLVNFSNSLSYADVDSVSQIFLSTIQVMLNTFLKFAVNKVFLLVRFAVRNPLPSFYKKIPSIQWLCTQIDESSTDAALQHRNVNFKIPVTLNFKKKKCDL